MKKAAPFLIILAGIFWGTMGIFLNLLKVEGFSSVQAGTVRITVAAIVFSVVLLICKPSLFKIKPKDLWLFICTGIISISGMCVLYLYTISNSNLATSAILLYMSPVVVMLLSAVFLKEKITLKGVIALVMATTGCALVAGVVSGLSVSWLTLLTGIGSAVAYGSYSIFGTLALKKYNPLTLTTYAFIFGSLALLILCRPGQLLELYKTSEHLGLLILKSVGIGVVTAVAPFVLYTVGLNNTTASKAAIFACSEPVAATAFGMIIYGEYPNLWAWMGIVLVLTAIVILNINIKVKKEG